MAFENLISISFTSAELSKLDEALKTISTIIKDKVVNLTPEQRRQYGSIAEQNKLFVNKAKLIMEQNPQHIPSFLDKEEFDKDHAAREQIEERLQKLAGLAEQLRDTKIVLDHDNYFNALSFYRNIKYLSNENVPGTSTLHKEMKQFFVSVRSSNEEDTDSDTQPIEE